MPENINDAVPTMGYAITAYKRSGGDKKSKYWQNYIDAVSHFSQIHGPQAAQQLQEIAYQTAGNKGDLNTELSKYSRSAIDRHQEMQPVIKNMLAMAYDGQNPLDKFQYAFDMPDHPTAKENPELKDRLRKMFNK